MSLIHTCDLNGADPFDYLNLIVGRHAGTRAARNIFAASVSGQKRYRIWLATRGEAREWPDCWRSASPKGKPWSRECQAEGEGRIAPVRGAAGLPKLGNHGYTCRAPKRRDRKRSRPVRMASQQGAAQGVRS